MNNNRSSAAERNLEQVCASYFYMANAIRCHVRYVRSTMTAVLL